MPTIEQQIKINTLVAEKVMGWEKVYIDSPGNYYWKGEGAPTSYERVALGITTPDFCNDIAAAWEVVKAMQNARNFFFFTCLSYTETENYACFFQGSFFGNTQMRDSYTSMPLAICLAALKAVGVDVSEYENH